jgi:hypothetical protein
MRSKTGTLARLVQGDDLAIDHRLVGDGGQRLDDPRKPAVEVLVIARSEMDGSAGLDRFSPESIELQFVYPSASFWKHVGAQKEHGSEEVALQTAIQRPVCRMCAVGLLVTPSFSKVGFELPSIRYHRRTAPAALPGHP